MSPHFAINLASSESEPEQLPADKSSEWPKPACIAGGLLATVTAWGAISLGIWGLTENERRTVDSVRDQATRDPITALKVSDHPRLELLRNVALRHLGPDQTHALLVEGFERVDSSHYSWTDLGDLLPTGKITPQDVVRVFGEEHPETKMVNIGVLQLRTHTQDKWGNVRVESMPRAYLLSTEASR